MRKKQEKDRIVPEELLPSERMEYEAMNADIEDTLEKYLPYVFREEHFVIGVDITGCYLFAESGSDQEIAVWVKELTDDLLLKNNEVCLCVVGRESKYNYCSKKMLGKYASRAVKSRKAVLTNRGVEEILAAYGISSIRETFYADYSETKLFRDIKSVLANYGWSLGESSINKICYLKPQNFQTLRDLGVPETALAEVLEYVSHSDNERPKELSEQKMYSGTDDNIILKPKKGKRILLKFLAFLVLILIIAGLCYLVWNNEIVQNAFHEL